MSQLVGHLAHWYLGVKKFLHVLHGPPFFSNKQAPSFYYINLVSLGAEGIRLPIREDVFLISNSSHRGVIMDTGTKTCALKNFL